MALKDLLNMTKADRYTADGCAELNKAREADVEDRTYKTGEISEKTGLQKQPDGSWAPPKKGGNPETKAGEGTLKPSRKPDQKKNPRINNPDVLGMTANGARKRMESFGAQFVENKNGKDYFKTTSGDLVEVEYGDNKKVLSSTTYTGGEKPEQAYPSTQGHDMQSYMSKLREEGWENQGWERNAANEARGIYKKGDKTIRVKKNWDGSLGGVSEIKTSTASKPAVKPTTEELNIFKDIVREFKNNPNKQTEQIMNEAKSHLMKNRGMTPEQLGKIGREVMAESKPAETKQEPGIPIQGSNWLSLPSGTRMTHEGAREKMARNNERIETIKKMMEGRSKADNFRLGSELKSLQNENEWIESRLPPEKLTPTDSAPRVLTGDCKIRVRKA